MAANDELLGFVKDALARRVPRSDIEQALVGAGWDAPQVSVALGGFAELDFPIPVPRPRPYWSAREAFLYLILFSTLYVSAYHAGSLLFDIIDRMFPDPAAPNAARLLAFAADRIRWSIASLVVALPVFLYVSALTNRETATDSSKRDSKVRRWLTYLTMFLAATILIGDVITLIYNALGGEVTIRFVLKVLTVGGIGGATFAYYRSGLKDQKVGR
jgi:hypothetical protein